MKAPGARRRKEPPVAGARIVAEAAKQNLLREATGRWGTRPRRSPCTEISCLVSDFDKCSDEQSPVLLAVLLLPDLQPPQPPQLLEENLFGILLGALVAKTAYLHWTMSCGVA